MQSNMKCTCIYVSIGHLPNEDPSLTMMNLYDPKLMKTLLHVYTYIYVVYTYIYVRTYIHVRTYMYLTLTEETLIKTLSLIAIVYLY